MITTVCSKYNILQALFQEGWLSPSWPMLAVANVESAPMDTQLTQKLHPVPKFIYVMIYVHSLFVSVVYNLTLLCHLEKKHKMEKGIKQLGGKEASKVCGDQQER